MNYYPFNVGDYAANTAHLEPMEDLAYRRMLDLYYLRECLLPEDPAEVARLIRMRSHAAEVLAVLNEFFNKEPGEGWSHNRCEAELSRMQDKQAKAKASAQASVNARIAKQASGRSTNAERTLNERSTDAELPTPTPTPTPTPEEKNKDPAQAPAPRKRGASLAVPPSALEAAGFTAEVAVEFIAYRHGKKAPLTERALADHCREADKAGFTPQQAAEKVMAKGWRGFEATYVARDRPVFGTSAQPGGLVTMSQHGLQTMRAAEALEKRLFGGMDAAA